MKNKTYDIWKAIAQIWLPAFTTAFCTIAMIWNLPYTEQICGTLVAIDTFLGAVLHIKTKNYYKGMEVKK